MRRCCRWRHLPRAPCWHSAPPPRSGSGCAPRGGSSRRCRSRRPRWRALRSSPSAARRAADPDHLAASAGALHGPARDRSRAWDRAAHRCIRKPHPRRGHLGQRCTRRGAGRRPQRGRDARLERAGPCARSASNRCSSFADRPAQPRPLHSAAVGAQPGTTPEAGHAARGPVRHRVARRDGADRLGGLPRCGSGRRSGTRSARRGLAPAARFATIPHPLRRGGLCTAAGATATRCTCST